MKNWLTQEIFDEETGHCDYWDWHYEAINFQWLVKRGVWHISYYDYSGIFNGKIEGSELTRCVCNDGQFTHFMIEGFNTNRVLSRSKENGNNTLTLKERRLPQHGKYHIIFKVVLTVV